MHRAAPSTSKVQIVGKRSQFSVHRLESGAVVQDQTGKQSRYNTNELVLTIFFPRFDKGQSNSMDRKMSILFLNCTSLILIVYPMPMDPAIGLRNASLE